MRTWPLALVFTAILAGPAVAHTGVGAHDGLLSGVLHPLTGLDHLIAMVAVGLWAAQLGRPGIWLLPLCFPVLMAAGAALGMAGVALPASECVIALSALVLGFAVAMGLRAPVWTATALVGLFAVFHGYAHGAEAPGTGALPYAAGFLGATALLHGAGVALGVTTRWPLGARIVRAAGAGIAGLGALFLLGMAA